MRRGNFRVCYDDRTICSRFHCLILIVERPRKCCEISSRSLPPSLAPSPPHLLGTELLSDFLNTVKRGSKLTAFKCFPSSYVLAAAGVAARGTRVDAARFHG